MTKKIIAVSLVILLIAVSFVACGKDKGYLLAKDQDGIEHAYVTDSEGNTVLSDDGNIRVYETDKNGEIATDADGNKRENTVEKPEYEASADKYETADFVLNITDGWKKAEGGKYIKGENADCFITVSKDFTDFKNGEGALEYKLQDTIALNEQVINKFKEQYPVAVFNHDYKEINGKNMYFLEYYVEDANKKAVLYSILYYFVVGENIYCITYADTNGKEYNPDYDFSTYIEKNLTIKAK